MENAVNLPVLTADNIAFLEMYIKDDPNCDPNLHQKTIKDLEILISHHLKKIEKTALRLKHHDFPNKEDYGISDLFTVVSYRKFLIKYEKLMVKYVMNALSLILSMANYLLILVQSHPTYWANIILFSSKIKKEFVSTKEYQDLIRIKNTLRYHFSMKVSNSHFKHNYLEDLKTELVETASKFECTLVYCPPTRFDHFLENFLFKSNHAASVKATVIVFSEGSIDEALSTLSALQDSICQSLNITADIPRFVVYISLLRLIFSESYTLNSELNKYNDENLLFLKKCYCYSRQTVRELKLSESIVKYYTPGLNVPSLFKSKQLQMLKQMEHMLNPIDLIFHVHTILGALAKYFAGKDGNISFDDMLTLLLALMSISPPVNAVAIAKFVEKWKDVQISDLFGVTKNYFVVAVNHLMQTKIDEV